MKKFKAYKLKIKSDKQVGKFHCPNCERRFHSALARTQHGVKTHQWSGRAYWIAEVAHQ